MENKKSVFITIDNSIENVLQYIKDEVEVFFKDDVGSFLELSEEDFKQLPKNVKTKYNTAKKTHALRKEQADEDALIAEIELGSRAANASSQVEILNKDPNYKYYLTSKNNVAHKKQKGYKLDKTGATCYGIEPTNGVKYVGYSDELVLMSQPKELADERKKLRDEKISKQFGDWIEATQMDYKE
jgi:hypothetical protein